MRTTWLHHLDNPDSIESFTNNSDHPKATLGQSSLNISQASCESSDAPKQKPVVIHCGAGIFKS